MKFLVLLGALVGCITATKGESARSRTGAQTVYFMSNIPKGNGIHALPVDSRGLVAEGTYTPTKGLGGRAPSTIGLTDALSAQSSLQIAGLMLFAVNAGSNTLSMLAIDANDPLNLTLVGTPVDTLGDFPNTIAVHKELNLVCVANSGTRSGIACFKYSESGLEPVDKTLRPLLLNPQQSTPPSGPFNTVSQIFFNKQSTALYATVKGDPLTKSGGVGYFSYFPLHNGTVAYRAVQSSPKGTEVLFGSVSLPDNLVFATDAAFGAVLLKISEDGVASTLQKSIIPHQAASCWAIYHPETNLVYVSDDGVNQITSFDPRTGLQVGQTTLTNGNPSMIEIRSAGKLLYALSHGNSTVPPHVVVMEAIEHGKIRPIQNFKPRNNAGIDIEGMVLLK